MNDIRKAINVLDDKFNKHPWVACLIKTMSMYDLYDENSSSEEMFDNVLAATIESCEDTHAELDAEKLKEDQDIFMEFLKDKSFAEKMYILFNV